jgi:hypothetical protein
LLPGLPSTPAPPPAALGALVAERPELLSFCFWVAVLGWTLVPAAGPVVLPAEPPVCCAQAADPMTSAEATAAPVKIVLNRISFLRLWSCNPGQRHVPALVAHHRARAAMREMRLAGPKMVGKPAAGA